MVKQFIQVSEEWSDAKPNLWALLVLDGRPDNSQKIEQLAVTLQEKYSFPSENVKILKSEEATCSEIVAAMGDLLNHVNKKTTVVVHFGDENIIEDAQISMLLTRLEKKAHRLIL